MWHCYQGHTKNTSSSTSQKYQPYVFSGNTWLGFMLAGAVGVVGCKVTPLQHKSQPCIPGEYVGLVVLDGGAAGIFGVALV